MAAKWQQVREMEAKYVDQDLVEAAYADPVLRGLFPLVAHGSLQFSRCTRFPWSHDLPSVLPLHGCLFRVLRLGAEEHSGGGLIGEGYTAAEAVAVLVAHLPAGCGPAVAGRPDVLEPLG